MAEGKRPYAQGTKVGVMQTHMQIQTMLKKAGAFDFMTFSRAGKEGLAFLRDGIAYRLVATLPETEEEAKKWSAGGRLSGHESYVELERARRMRSLLLVVKARLTAMDDGIQTFEEAFFGDALTDNDQTVAERMVPRIKQAALSGHYPSALPMPGEQ